MSECPFSKGDIEDAYPEECKDPDRLVIVANENNPNIKIEKANQRVQWMDDSHNRFANRCLPLLSANELGWVISCPKTFTATWNGDNYFKTSIKIEHDGDGELYGVGSHFGQGILTFHTGYMFQTSKGHGLYVKGPTNRHKSAIYPLEGLVETDWLTFTFTMNWKFTEKNKPVTFEKGEPFCQIFPYPRDYVNKFETIQRPMSEGTKKLFSVFCESRKGFNEDPERTSRDWQKNYFRGMYHDGTSCEEFGFKHEPKCNASKFKQD